MKLKYITKTLTPAEEISLRMDIKAFQRHITEHPEDAETYRRMLSIAEKTLQEHELLTDAQIAGTDPVSVQVDALLSEAVTC